MEKLNNMKSALKGTITKIENFLKTGDPPKEGDIHLFEVKLQKVLDLQKKTEHIRENYYDIPDVKDLPIIEAELDECDERLEDLQVRFKTYLASFNKNSNCDYSGKIALKDNEHNSSKIKLPEIPLPTFSGKLEEWNNFKTQFSNLIKDNKELSDEQKLFYLRGCLRSEARQVESVDDNFNSLFTALTDRFENKRLLIDNHIFAIMNIEKIQCENAKELQNLIDIINRNVRALKILDYERNNFTDILLVNIILPKLDKETRKQYEYTLKTSEVPKFNDLIDFLENRSAILLSLSRNSSINNSTKNVKNSPFPNKGKTLMIYNKEENKTKHCFFCNGFHPLYKCFKFQQLTASDKLNFIKSHKICQNCLSKHFNKCLSKATCLIPTCRSNKHHTLIHESFVKSADVSQSHSINRTDPHLDTEKQFSESTENKITFSSDELPNEKQTKVLYQTFNDYEINNQKNKTVLLSTIYAYILDKNGKKKRLRFLVDSASQINILSLEVAEILGLQKIEKNMCISGISRNISNLKFSIMGNVSNKDNSFEQSMEFFLIEKIADCIPATQLDISKINLPPFIELADSNFFRPSSVSGIIGAQFFYQILKGDKFELSENLLLVNSVFGWIVTGSLDQYDSKNNAHCHLLITNESLDLQLKRFFNLEALGISDWDPKVEEDKAQEIHDQTTSYSNGRYEVQLPWKKDWKNLGDNFSVAKQRLRGLLKKFKMNNDMYFQYHEILKEYLDKDIVRKIDASFTPIDRPIFYLPHQAVIRKESLTTKMRIVFDASSHDVGQLSLNDYLWPGVNLNPNIFDLLIQLRLHKILILADIEKAFLQIVLAERDRGAVRFLFPDDISKAEVDLTNIAIYQFNRLIFGLNASPFILAATIKRHINNFTENYPKTVKILNECFYVDDLATGQDDLNSAMVVSQEADFIMKQAGMRLRKWISNDPLLMDQWKINGFEVHPNYENIDSHKILGIPWSPKPDLFTIDIRNILEKPPEFMNTKRLLIQTIGKIYDPLGFLAPFTIRAKILFQELWKEKISWDDNLPPKILTEWHKWGNELIILENLKIPRVILNSSENSANDVIEIHSFSDSSKRAYGACVYLRIIRENGIEANLIAAKSRVAPLKELTLPRLELLGALLSARLTNNVKKVIDQKKTSKSFYYTDSSIVLCWIKGSANKWKQFVANRVKEIQTLTNPEMWCHCPGTDNPADLITRGISSTGLLDNSMWWHGPTFLTSGDFPILSENCQIQENEVLSEMKKTQNHSNSELKTFIVKNDPDFFNCLVNISNSYIKILHVVAFLYRFIRNCRIPDRRITEEVLQQSEIEKAEIFLVRNCQAEFSKEISLLKEGKNVHTSSKIKSLSPFLDGNGLLRVKGRLGNSSLTFNQKYPYILPNSKFTEILILYYHKKYLHAGPQTLLYQLRQKYWPLNGRNLCRRVVHKCVQCFKANPKLEIQKMGDLPSERVNRNFVFNSVGIDLCGYFYIKNKNQRKGSPMKIYVGIFICLVTKAIHLEIISDLTSGALIAALKRFISRRGKCSKIHSDNGSNLVRANKDLKEFYKLVQNKDEKLSKFFLEENIEWKFIPPRAPNFGGLWEAGVKSFKYYLKRTIGDTRLTYEEFLTIIVQVESILNSRPLSPLSSDLDDLEILTPGHFLIGRPMTLIPEPNLLNIETNRLSLWQKTTKMVQFIWKKWSTTYLNNLQQRTKWYFEKDNIKIGDMVLIKEDNLPPSKWLLGHIIKTYRGKDNRIRVADIKTEGGILKRPVSRLGVLPLEK